MKANGWGIKPIHLVEAFFVIVFAFVGYLLATTYEDAQDTLKNAVTKEDVTLILEARTVPREGIEEMILKEIEPDQVRLESIDEKLDEFKKDFDLYKKEEREDMKQFKEEQMNVLEQINSKLDK